MELGTNERKALYISPSRVRQTSQDFVEGFGSKEAIITAISAVVAIVVFFITNSAMNNIIVIPLAIAIVIIGGTVMMVFRDEYNESMIDKIGFIIQFNLREQKRYEYKYHDIRFPNIRKFYETEENE